MDIFEKTLENLTKNEKYKINVDVNQIRNTDFYKSLKNPELDDYFKDNNGENKINFAKEYVKTLQDNFSEDYIPSWIKAIKKEF